MTYIKQIFPKKMTKNILNLTYENFFRTFAIARPNLEDMFLFVQIWFLLKSAMLSRFFFLNSKLDRSKMKILIS